MIKDNNKIEKAQQYLKNGKRVVSSYKNKYNQKYPISLFLDDALERIRKGGSQKEIHKMRNEHDIIKYERLKSNLFSVTFAGLFKNVNELQIPSGLACLDFDKVKSLKHHQNKLAQSKYIMAHWISPSGNGIKALVKIPFVEYKKHYVEYYKALMEYYKDLKPDIDTSNFNRLCHESYDPNIYINYDSEVFTEKIEIKEYIPSLIKSNRTTSTESQIIDRLIKWWRKNYIFSEGNRNNSLFVLACSFCKFGINKDKTKHLLYSFISSSFTSKEIDKIINSAYRTTAFHSKSFSR